MLINERKSYMGRIGREKEVNFEKVEMRMILQKKDVVKNNEGRCKTLEKGYIG